MHHHGEVLAESKILFHGKYAGGRPRIKSFLQGYRFRQDPVPSLGGYHKGDSASKRGNGLNCLREKAIAPDQRYGYECEEGIFQVKGRSRMETLRYVTDHGGPKRAGWGEKDWKKAKKRKQWM